MLEFHSLAAGKCGHYSFGDAAISPSNAASSRIKLEAIIQAIFGGTTVVVRTIALGEGSEAFASTRKTRIAPGGDFNVAILLLVV